MSSDKFERILTRKKQFYVNGQQFPFPRRLVERIYYERHNFFRPSEWPQRCVCSAFVRLKGVRKVGAPKEDLRCVRRKEHPKVVLRKTPVYSQALAFERVRDSQDFTRELRKDSKRFSKQVYSRRVQTKCANEAYSNEVREKTLEQNYIKSLSGKNDNQ